MTEKNCNVAQIYIGCFLKFPPQLNVYCRIYKLFVMRYALRKQDKIKAVLETGYYGEIYKWLYYQSKK